MDSRDNLIIQIRPSVVTDGERVPLTEEHFQNTALRPILKIQHDLFVELLKARVQLPEKDLEKFITLTLQKDTVLRNQFIGMVVGMFTQTEIQYYSQQSSAVNKRIIQLLQKRLTNHFTENT